jgi:hypothetical protein
MRRWLAADPAVDDSQQRRIAFLQHDAEPIVGAEATVDGVGCLIKLVCQE